MMAGYPSASRPLLVLVAAAVLALLLPPRAQAFMVRVPAAATTRHLVSNGRPVVQPVSMDSSRSRPFTTPRLYNGEEEMMILTPENAELAIDLARKELGTLFGYSKENQEVGITGEVDFVDLDGVAIIVDLKGRFWHDRKMVLARVEKFVQNRIPECFEVRVRDPRQLEAGNDDATSVEQFYRH